MNVAAFAIRLGIKRTFEPTLKGIIQKVQTFFAQRQPFDIPFGQIAGLCFSTMMSPTINRGKKGQNFQIFFFFSGHVTKPFFDSP